MDSETDRRCSAHCAHSTCGTSGYCVVQDMPRPDYALPLSIRSHRVACARTRVARRVLASFAPKQKIQSRGWAKNVVASAGCRMEFSYDGTTTSTRECVLYRISMVYNVVDVCERSRSRRLFFTRSSLDAAEFRNRDAEALELLQNRFIIDGWKLGETGG